MIKLPRPETAPDSDHDGIPDGAAAGGPGRMNPLPGLKELLKGFPLPY